MFPQRIVEARNFYGATVGDFEMTEEQEIENRVQEEMDKVFANMHPSSSSTSSSSSSAASSAALSSSSASVRMDTRQLLKGFNNASTSEPSIASNWSTPTIFASKLTIQLPSSGSTHSERHSNDVDEEVELRTRHEIEEKVKKRAQELFEKMRRDQEEQELKNIEAEINHRVTEEARKKAAQLFREEQLKIAEEENVRQSKWKEEEKARQQAAEELIAQQAATIRRIEEQVQQRVEEEALRIKELILQSIQTPPSQSVQPSPRQPTEMILVPLGQKIRHGNNNKFLPSIVENSLEEEQNSGDVSFEQEFVACDMWNPLSPVKWPRSRGRVDKVDQVSTHQQLPSDLMSTNPREDIIVQTSKIDRMASIACKMTTQGDEETKMGGEKNLDNNNEIHNERSQDFAHSSSDEDKEPDHGISHGMTRSANTIVGSSQITDNYTLSVGVDSMSLTAIEIEQLIAAEVEKRIAARDAIALAKTAEAVAISADAVAIAETAQAVAISATRTLHEWKKNESYDGKIMKQKVRRNSIGGDADYPSRRGSPSSYSATTTTTTTTTETNVFIGNAETDPLVHTPNKPRSTSMGGEVSVESPPFNLRDDPLRDATNDGSMSPPSSANKGLLLPLPRAKQTFTPERARAAMLAAAAAAAQLGPLANATAHLLNGGVCPVGWKTIASMKGNVDGPSEMEFLDATFTGQKYAGLQLSSHRVAYTVLDTDNTDGECKTATAAASATTTRVVDCCMVHMTTLKSQIMTGDILISVNDWPLINIPSDTMEPGVGHFETVLKLLRLATPPRRIRFMRSAETNASLSGLSDIPILKLTADDALLMYDGLASEDYHALTLDVTAAAMTEQQLMHMQSRVPMNHMTTSSHDEEEKVPGSVSQPKTEAGTGAMAADNSVKSSSGSTFDVTDSPLSLSSPPSARPSPPPLLSDTTGEHNDDIVLTEMDDMTINLTSIPPPAPPSSDEPSSKSTPGVESSSSRERDTYSEMLIDCAASALTTNTGVQGHRLSSISDAHGGRMNAIPSEHPSAALHTASDGLESINGSTNGGTNVRSKKRVTGFFKAMGRVMGLRRSAKSNNSSNNSNNNQSNSNNNQNTSSSSNNNNNNNNNSHQQVDRDRSSMMSFDAGSSDQQIQVMAARIEGAAAIGREATNEVGSHVGGGHSIGSRSVTDHRQASLSLALPQSLPSAHSQAPLQQQQQQQQQPVASMHSKCFPNPGSLGLKLAYHNIMFADSQGYRHSINCLVVGNHESPPLASAPSSSSSMGMPQDSSNTSTLMRPGDILIDINNTSIVAKLESHDHIDETAAPRFFHQAVTILGQANLPRNIRFFRLSDPRTVTTGRVFTVLTALETSILIPHISLMTMMQ